MIPQIFSMTGVPISDCGFSRRIYSPASMQARVQFSREWLEQRRRFKASAMLHALLPLRHLADLRSLLFVALLIGAFAIQWSDLLRHWTLLTLTCLLTFIACIIKHNHIHSRTFARRSWNRAFEIVLSFCTGQSTAAIIPVHNERHHAQYHTDADFVRSSVVDSRNNWLNLLLFPFVVVWLVHENKSRDFLRWREEKPTLYRRVQRERLAVYLFVAALLIMDWKATLIYFGIPWLFGHWGIVTINLLQHQDCDHDSAYDHSRNITGRFINWLFVNNGYHTAHHLRPALHWSLLPHFHRREIEPAMRPELNHRSLLVCIWKQFFWRRQRERA